MSNRLLSAFILSVGVAFSGYFIGHGFYLARTSQSVEVKGLAEEIVKSNAATWSLSIKLVNDDLPTLYEGISKTQLEAKRFLIGQGFQEGDIILNAVSVIDNQSINYNQNQNMPRFSADVGITLNTNQVDHVAEVMQKTGDLVKQGMVVTSSNTNFRFTNLNEIKPKMLAQATKSARIAAESFAHDAEAKLGNIIHATQGLFTITDANSNFDSGMSIMKKVRIVTTVEYKLGK